MITYKLKINYQDSKILQSNIEFVSGDIRAYLLECEFYDSGKRVDVSDYSVTLKAKRADGVILSEGGKIEENKGIIALKNDIYSVPGELYLEIALLGSAKNYITTKIILANVIEGLGETDETSGNASSVYVTLLNQMKSEINALTVALADAKETGANIKESLLGYATKEELSEKQDTLTSGTNIKTINGESVLGEGDIEIQNNGIKGVARNTTSSSGWVKFVPDENGIVNIPCAAPGQAGLVITGSGLGSAKPHGYVSVTTASQSSITNRWAANFIDTKILDLAVREAMCDGIGAAWNNTQKLAALLRLGCTVDENGFVKWGTE